MEQTCLFGPNFLEKFVGKHILYDPKVALVELIANAWDAGARDVNITWPTSENEQLFSITDDGEGLTKEEFLSRWRTLAYDRTLLQGKTVRVSDKTRSVFGRNGVGRFAGFCFGDSYFVESTKNGNSILYEVKTGSGESPFSLLEHSSLAPVSHGTKIYSRTPSKLRVKEEEILAEVGMRFLTDPSFNCYINGTKVSFAHIPETNIIKNTIILESGNSIEITIIDTQESDKTTKQHGIAWHVKGRLVGEANWKSYGLEEIVDGRSTEAKRHTFIIKADFLANEVSHDWTGFKLTQQFEEAKDAVFNYVKEHILGQTKEKRQQTLESIKTSHQNELQSLTPLRRERWEGFVSKVQEECTSISANDLNKVAGVLVSLEKSDTKYSLISRLHELDSSQLDNLNTILSEWSLDLAKEVLDELQLRLKLIDELMDKVLDEETREVQDLQPLFHQGLWIFGPEFETIEFTSNQGMTKVIQQLFKSDTFGSKNRPDFAIMKDSSVGSYSYPSYDEEGGENGVDRLVIVELKKPGVPIGADEKSQCWKYVTELMRHGLIDHDSKITCFVLSRDIDPIEKSPRKDNDRCTIIPMTYTTVLERAKSRLLKLYDRVKSAPFLEEQRESSNYFEEQKVIDFS